MLNNNIIIIFNIASLSNVIEKYFSLSSGSEDKKSYFTYFNKFYELDIVVLDYICIFYEKLNNS